MKVLFVRSYNHGVDYITQRQAQSLEEKGIQVVFYNIVGTGLKGYFKNIIPLRKLMQTEKPELIHAHYSLSGIVATLTFTSKPIVVSLMGSDVLSTNKLIFLFTRFLSKFFWSQTIVKSDEMYNVLANQKAIVIPNGVDLNTFKPRPIDETREKLNWSSSMLHVLFASDPNRPEKNYALTKAALDKVKEHIPSIEVHFLKGLNTLQMVDHYNAADLLLLTSNHEGSPNVIKEAMACNCPIVSTKVGDVANVINGTENSFLVNFKADEIAEKISQILKQKTRSNGRENIQKLSSEKTAERIIDLYSKIIRRKIDYSKNYQRCSIGLWDTTIPNIKFDDKGVSNYAKMQLSLMKQYPRGEKGMNDWERIVEKMKSDGRSKAYDCIIGISGGTDSSYLLHIAHQYKLRVLAVYLDNGWGSNIAVSNIEKMTQQLNYDLKTFVIDYEEVKTVLKSYILAGLPWIDSPTDIAIKSVLYKAAAQYGVKYALNGGDFRSEGKQPLAWTYSDSKQLNYVVKKFSGKRLKNYPQLTLAQLGYYGLIKKIKAIRPLYYLPYEKKQAKQLLESQYGWVDYGGHHHENIFTKFAISYWLPKKFNIDKRIITYSAQVLSNEIVRDDGLALLENLPYDKQNIQTEIEYVIKKLDLSATDFERAFKQPNNYFYDYPSYYPTIKKFSKIGKSISKLIFGFKPGIFEALDQDI